MSVSLRRDYPFQMSHDYCNHVIFKLKHYQNTRCTPGVRTVLVLQFTCLFENRNRNPFNNKSI